MSYSDQIAKFKKVLINEFEMTNLGNILIYCKSAITPTEINHKLDSDVEGDDIDATTFKQLVGSLRYPCNIRHVIYYEVGVVSRFMNKIKWSHYQDVVRILRYIEGTLKYGVLLPYDVESDSELICYSDSDWCGYIIERRSTSGYFFKYLGGPTSWCSKKQPVVALLTCEDEYIAGALSACQTV
ncbi:secreted RxLR effector protein 161-like [Lathyrus oleraceus]|uniref:secreted RxLR effector protein 161-like n=1 Tax=Pisum sativum TaxID=3888 RepID=UPI0021D1B672|nr:secreted RxLR effector protein 161-like [Pisum sativum]